MFAFTFSFSSASEDYIPRSSSMEAFDLNFRYVYFFVRGGGGGFFSKFVNIQSILNKCFLKNIREIKGLISISESPTSSVDCMVLASSTLCNLLLEFSPSKEPIGKKNREIKICNRNPAHDISKEPSYRHK